MGNANNGGSMTFGKHAAPATSHTELSSDELAGKHGDALLVLSGNGRNEISLTLRNKPHGFDTTQTATFKDMGAALLECVELTLKPADETQVPFTVVVSRYKSDGFSNTTWDVDFGNHPRAVELNRVHSMGYAVSLGNCTVESVRVGRSATKQAGSRLASFF
jgi:hypothetical protein